MSLLGTRWPWWFQLKGYVNLNRQYHEISTHLFSVSYQRQRPCCLTTAKKLKLQHKNVQTAKNQYQKLETNIPRKGIAQPKSQFPHSCVCERFIYSHIRSAYFAAGNMWTDPYNIYVNRSQTHECRNWDWGRTIPRKEYINGIFVQCTSLKKGTYF